MKNRAGTLMDWHVGSHLAAMPMAMPSVVVSIGAAEVEFMAALSFL